MSDFGPFRCSQRETSGGTGHHCCPCSTASRGSPEPQEQAKLLKAICCPPRPHLSSLSPPFPAPHFRLSLHPDPPLLSWRNTPPAVPSVGQPGWDASLCPLRLPYPTLCRGDRWASQGASPLRRLDEMVIQASGQAGTKAEPQASLTQLGALGGRLSPEELPDLFCAPTTRPHPPPRTSNTGALPSLPSAALA